MKTPNVTQLWCHTFSEMMRDDYIINHVMLRNYFIISDEVLRY